MRCPKCHYISFDNSERCRNCGYEFSLALEAGDLDLPIQTGSEALGPLEDFSLADLDSAAPVEKLPPVAFSTAAPSIGTAPAASQAAVRRPAPGTDLPLFKDRAPDDGRPLVTPAAVPRAPLSVRRSTPGPPRPAVRRDEPRLDLQIDAPVQEERRPRPAARPDSEQPLEAALPGPRLAAAAVDASVLGAIDGAVLYLTAKLCGLALLEVFVLPLAPLSVFLALLTAAYFVTFTAAGGQTIGKMAAGIKVVPAHGEGLWSDRVRFGTAVLRAAAYLVSVLPLGLGFLPALVGSDRRALHDRLADTRVVQA
ncbi:MAG: hypothetical protein A3H96_14340 [Acidobacteria bacterium RIFCSPLOWO2_02_FULL_67_36]|nr:MAG: hypothetical protein A3H96_14340 [Acidobacteria bacterium RIFCSPLOWO2_02_FULL_67_36]OFW18408.1 MAG: hypothetical protein A3G21_07850 [Acidobacteria bacterium RIFCSPLOWO2_12_FULL_66_21]